LCSVGARAGIARKDRPVRLEVGAANNAPQRRRFNQSNQSNRSNFVSSPTISTLETLLLN
jgi:hypothetical protein